MLYARSWRLSGTDYPSRETIDLMLDVLIPQIAVLPGNAAAGLLVVADAQDRQIDVWDVVYHAPPPPVVNRDLPPERP